MSGVGVIIVFEVFIRIIICALRDSLLSDYQYVDNSRMTVWHSIFTVNKWCFFFFFPHNTREIAWCRTCSGFHTTETIHRVFTSMLHVLWKTDGEGTGCERTGKLTAPITKKTRSWSSYEKWIWLMLLRKCEVTLFHPFPFLRKHPWTGPNKPIRVYANFNDMIAFTNNSASFFCWKLRLTAT